MPRQQNGFAPVTLMLTWAVFIFLFFSASHSKLVSYTLPVAPALALLLGAYLSTVTRAQWQRHLCGYAVFLVAAAFGALFLGRLGDARTPNALYRAFQLYVWIAIGTALVLTLVALWLNRRGGLRSSQLITTTQTPAPATVGIVMFASAWIALASIAGNGHEVFGRESSGVLLAPAIKAELARLPADTPFYSVGVLDHTLPFYIGHTTIMVAWADELAFGVSVEPGKWVPSYDAFVQRWNSDAQALALMPPKTYLRFAAEGLPMRVVARDNRRVVVEKVEKERKAGKPSE
jgi:4-amino-4-deoxy-L-arabinose transferase-like glycosyltransferase